MTQPHLPEPVAIEAYGNGGFRFSGMSHNGSLLIVPSGIYSWPVSTIDKATPDDFSAVWDEADQIGFLLLGTGLIQTWPDQAIESAFSDAGVALEIMQTGAAVRTYNVLLAEKRPVAAALIAVESHR